MKQSFLFCSLFFYLSSAIAQTDDASRYAAMITGEGLKAHLTVIAGEEMEGRETGTEGQRKAAVYIENEFKKLGLQYPGALKGYQQYYPIYKDSVIGCTVKAGNKKLKFGTDFYTPPVNNEAGRSTAQKIVFAGYGIDDEKYNDYKNIDAKGKVLVMFLGEPKADDGDYILSGGYKYSKYTYPGIRYKLEVAKKKGAAAVLFINQSMEKPDSLTLKINSETGYYFPHSGDDDNPNYIVLSHKAAKQVLKNWKVADLITTAKSAGTFEHVKTPVLNLPVSIDYKKAKRRIDASNVLGVLEGTDKKDEYIFLTAHYDHLGKKNGKIYYGADDDGSGTCAVIQMAEAFTKAKAEGKGPRRTIVFMTVSGEEKGLWGSEYYSDHPVYPLDKTSVDLNTDMIGRIDTERQTADSSNYLYVIGHDKLSTDLVFINESANNKHTRLTLDYKFDDPNDPERIYFRSDHYNFARKGVPVLFFYDGMLLGDYHKPTDTVDKINWALYEKRTRLIFYTAWEMANMDSMLKRDLPIPEGTR
ncbi:MAG: M28 family peptidase [Ferruginibacter sp.]